MDPFGEPTALSMPGRDLRPDTVLLLLKALQKQWKRYRKCLKECQKEFSEPAVHDSRVQTRRLLSMLELLGPFLAPAQLEKARRSLKRHLDTFDDLRDTHVQLLTVARFGKRHPAAASFEAYLRKREKRFRRRTRKDVKRIKTKRLGKLIQRWEEQAQTACTGAAPDKTCFRVLEGLQRAYAKATRLKEKINPGDTRTIHTTRVAFKKFRYMVEVLVSFVPGSHRRLLSAMHAHQTLMGDIQDAEVLLAAYDKYLRKSHAPSEAALVLKAELLQRKDALVDRYLARSNDLYKFRPAYPGTLAGPDGPGGHPPDGQSSVAMLARRKTSHRSTRFK